MQRNRQPMLCHPTHSSPVSVHLPSNLYRQSLRALKDQASFRLPVNVCDPVGSCRWFFSCLNLVAVQLSKSVHEKRNRSKDKRAYTHFSTCLCGTGRYEKGGVKMVTLMLLYRDIGLYVWSPRPSGFPFCLVNIDYCSSTCWYG